MRRRSDALISRHNYRDTRAYLLYQDEVLHAADGSLRLYRTALDHFLRWATDIPFAKAPEIRPVFPRYLDDLGGAASYQGKLLEIARMFLDWARERHPESYPGHAYMETLRPIKGNPGVVPERKLYTLDDMLRLAETKAETLTEQRDRAAACLLFLSGIRATAFVTLPLQAVILERYEVRQWPALGVKTKNSKAGTTYLLQNREVEPLLAVVRAWDRRVREELEATAPWYALIDRTGNMFAEDQMQGHSRVCNLALHLKRLCARGGLSYLSPHKFRHGFAVYALSLCETMEDFKAVSQNLMHEQMGTTDSIYSRMLTNQVANRIAQLGQHSVAVKDEARLLELAQELFKLVQ